ncbi:hypothetical protein [Hymenobacter pini]|uniref:hypothetical protein n=1 Tax=Hymenobacter pini TaxID=2880879 RepID=UPI001CF2BA46|nr:hypothetical protein [Hymenobacter pini]MCA8830637.1 hypothetical protein [Hymenobacter pini]
MSQAHTRVLLKVVAKGFYQVNTGLLLSLLILVFSNFFYTNVLNQTHLTPDKIIETALQLAISSVSEPQGVVIFLLILWVYSAKTWQYVGRRLQVPDATFLRYSLNALRPRQQLGAWAIVQLVMALPLVVMSAYGMLVGVVYGHWVVPLLLPGYLLVLVGYSARRYYRLTNNLHPGPATTTRPRWLRGWPKPLFSLFLFELLGRQRLAFFITKVAAAISILLFFSVFPDSRADVRLIGLMALSVALIHVLLLYQSNEFELTYVRFARNFPYSQWQLYGQQVALFGMLLLPEALWIFWGAATPKAVIGFLMMLSSTLLFRAVLYQTGRHMQQYLRAVFGLFMFLLLLGLFGHTELLAAGCFLVAGGLQYRRRYAE